MHRDGTTGPAEPRRDPSDVVFDYSDVSLVDLPSLSLLLTARQMAHEDHRRVWLRGLPDRTWQLLHALGLEDWFELFPASGDPLN